MKAVPLAVRPGIRLRHETELRSEPMVEIGSTPMPSHPVKSLNAQRIAAFVVCARHTSKQIASYFANYGMMNKDLTVGLGGDQLSVTEFPPFRALEDLAA